LLLAGKDWTARAKTAETAREVMDAMRQGEDRMYEIFADLAAKPVSDVIELQKSLRVVPSIRLDTPAVVLVGAPNVGKSSIVRAISSVRLFYLHPFYYFFHHHILSFHDLTFLFLLLR
jgi:nucleolar GTP-binding protein